MYIPPSMCMLMLLSIDTNYTKRKRQESVRSTKQCFNFFFPILVPPNLTNRVPFQH